MADDLAFSEPAFRSIEAGGCAPPVYVAVAPEPVARNPFDRLLFDRGVENPQAAEDLACSRQTIFLLRLPFGHPKRLKPGRDLAARIEAWSGGAVDRAAFDDPPSADGAGAPP